MWGFRAVPHSMQNLVASGVSASQRGPRLGESSGAATPAAGTSMVKIHDDASDLYVTDGVSVPQSGHGVKRKAEDDGNGWRGGRGSCPLGNGNSHDDHGQLEYSARAAFGPQPES